MSDPITPELVIDHVACMRRAGRYSESVGAAQIGKQDGADPAAAGLR